MPQVTSTHLWLGLIFQRTDISPGWALFLSKVTFVLQHMVLGFHLKCGEEEGTVCYGVYGKGQLQQVPGWGCSSWTGFPVSDCHNCPPNQLNIPTPGTADRPLSMTIAWHY
jgi:hypothetical protein